MMHLRWIFLFGALATLAGCETKQPVQWIAGPSVLPVPTTRPYTWDSRDELNVWVNNPVTRGRITVEGQGAEAFIHMRLEAGDEVVLRGPDFQPSLSGLRGVRLRFRCARVLDTTSCGSMNIPWLVRPVDPPWPTIVLTGPVLQGATQFQWSETEFRTTSSDSVNARYVYYRNVHAGSPLSLPAYVYEMDIDWISVFQQ